MELLNTQFLTFIIVTIILTITPGVDTVIVMRNVLRGGKKDGLFTSIGICSGLYFHATISAVGISLILVSSVLLFTIVKIIGAIYLIWLGLTTIYYSVKNKQALVVDENLVHCRVNPNQSFREGLLSNILNPKPAIFYMAFLPQFIGPLDSVFFKSMFLASIQFTIGLVWLIALTILFYKIKDYLTSDNIKIKLDRLTGTVLIVLGLNLATQSN